MSSSLFSTRRISTTANMNLQIVSCRLKRSVQIVLHVIQKSKLCLVRFLFLTKFFFFSVSIMAVYVFVGLMTILGFFAVVWRCYEESKEDLIEVKLPCSVDKKLVISKEIDRKTGLPVISLTDNTSLIKVEYI